jgi:hypothetical protein
MNTESQRLPIGVADRHSPSDNRGGRCRRRGYFFFFVVVAAAGFTSISVAVIVY